MFNYSWYQIYMAPQINMILLWILKSSSVREHRCGGGIKQRGEITNLEESVCSSSAGLQKQPRVEADCSSHPRFWGLSGKTSPLCVTLLLETMWIWEGYLKVVLNLKAVSLMFKKQERNFLHSKMNKWYKEDLTQQKTWCISFQGKNLSMEYFHLFFHTL